MKILILTLKSHSVNVETIHKYVLCSLGMISLAPDITDAGHKLEMKPKLALIASAVSILLSFSILLICYDFLI